MSTAALLARFDKALVDLAQECEETRRLLMEETRHGEAED